MLLAGADILSAQSGTFEIKKVFTAKKQWYASWGYNRESYSKSTIRMHTGSKGSNNEAAHTYDFKIHNAVATDRPNFEHIPKILDLTIPQFQARLGFVSQYRNLGLELSYDHAKYIMLDNQNLRVTGNFFGKQVDTIMNTHFVHFEHSDGANFWQVSVTKTFKIIPAKKYVGLSTVSKMGAGPVIPRTDVWLDGERKNNPFHLAGYVLGAEQTAKMELGKHLFLELSGKLAWANYTNAYINKEKHTYAQHQILAYMAMAHIGFIL